MIRPTKQKGFTIVETLVAITILMISIAGPLVVASKGLSGANLAKNQMFASFIAQESMEVVKNRRDYNISSGVSWLTSFSTCTINTRCDASAFDTVPFVSCAGGGMCPIKEMFGEYGHNAFGTYTIFSRSFYIHAANADTACVSDEECGITVEVAWYEGTTPYNIVLTSEITNTLR